jgi:anhydro-N-acetylmuramic acid kinase
MNNYTAIGIMSGTSVDGLDVILCNFKRVNKKWKFKIIKANTFFYSNKWKRVLSNADKLGAYDFIKFHKEYGKFIGLSINKFLNGNKGEIDFIASHGHTIFHQPDKNLTFQIGDGAVIAATTGITTISDFRSLDIALGGQGAPLVPIGDKFLFSEYDFCLNLGGFANISFHKNKKQTAFDICPVNIVINYLTQTINKQFDRDGKIAKKGNLNNRLLYELNNIAFYKIKAPKSLGKEWVVAKILPIINKYNIKPEDKLRTIYEHIANQISQVLNNNKDKTVLLTGGGTYNKFLIKLIDEQTDCELIIPDNNIIDFKEALIFAFLGLLRYRNKINCLSSVTGAKRDNSGGVISVCQLPKACLWQK